MVPIDYFNYDIKVVSNSTEKAKDVLLKINALNDNTLSYVEESLFQITKDIFINRKISVEDDKILRLHKKLLPTLKLNWFQ